MIPLAVVHRVSIPAPATHLVHVETTLSAGAALPDSIVAAMPVWTPGSYLVREYARHVEGFQADPPALAAKVRKNAWQLRTGGATRVVFRYRVYAAEMTVRTSHVDESHAFLVGAALFFAIEGYEDRGARIYLTVPTGWRVATALPAASNPADGDTWCFESPDFDTLVDSPIEIGTHREERFEVRGKPHRYAVVPADAIGDADVRRLVDDTKTINETEANFFGGDLPYENYELLLHLAQRGRGGLEHCNGAAFVAPAASFATRDAYLDLLSLVAHEVFHAWNIKRIRPEGLTPYRYGDECYTRLLWWFEGGTSYYDWRTLVLARLCTIDEYLDHLASEIAYLDQTPGKFIQTLEEASYDAWIKLYRPDENSANSSISYYRKGEVVCALFDLEIAARTAGRANLDAVLAHLWQRYGLREEPVPENGLQAVFEEVAHVPLGDLFDSWIRGVSEIDYAETLAHVGLTLDRAARAEAPDCSLGVRLRLDGGRVVVTSTVRDSGAWRAGIAAGDEIIAVAGVRVDAANLDGVLRGRAAGQRVDVTLARNGCLALKEVTLDPPRLDRVRVVARADAPPVAREAFAAWLGQPFPAASRAKAAP